MALAFPLPVGTVGPATTPAIRTRVGAALAATIASLALLLASGCSSESHPDAPAGRTAPATVPAETSDAPATVVADALADPARDLSDDERVLDAIRTPWTGDLDAMAKRRFVRVLVPYRRPEYFHAEGRPTGVLVEAFNEFERILNAKYHTGAKDRIVVLLMPTPSDRMRGMMAEGRADIVAAGLTITERNKATADFSVPTATDVQILVVTGPGAPALASLDDLSGQHVWVNPLARFPDDLEALNTRLTARGKPPVVVERTDPALDPGDVLEMVNAGIYPITVTTSLVADFWEKVFDRVTVRRDLVLEQAVETGWALRKGTPQLKALVDEFVRSHRRGTSFGNTLMQRYLKEAKYVRNATEPGELKKFAATVSVFKRYGERYRLPYLLLIAQAYQESRLDQRARSRAGAVGIMQIKPSTAAGPPVRIANINTVDGNVHAGARLLRFLVDDHFAEPGIDTLNKVLLAFAAYNAGPAKIRRLRDEAARLGFDANKWFGNVEVVVARRVGRETTQYVANIFKYFLAFQLANDVAARRAPALERARGRSAR